MEIIFAFFLILLNYKDVCDESKRFQIHFEVALVTKYFEQKKLKICRDTYFVIQNGYISIHNSQKKSLGNRTPRTNILRCR